MDTLQLMLMSLLIGATVSTSSLPLSSPAVSSVYAPSSSSPATPTPQIIYVTASPQIIYVTPEPTPEPTPAPTASLSAHPTFRPAATAKTIYTGTSITRELYRGCSGSDVSMLQRLLKDLGYSVGSVDGNFGAQTRSAVMAFQRNNGLSADGIAGARTIRRLVSSSAVRGDVSSSKSRDQLSYGMSGSDVLSLQQWLSAYGYYSGSFTGNYLSMTRSAVRWFQQVNSLSVDGVAGPATLGLLYSGTALRAGSVATPAPTAVPFSRTLRQGLSGSDVTRLQNELKSLGYFTGSATGYFGAYTYWAVCEFQRCNGLAVDGIAGAATLSRLASGVYYPGPASAATAAPTLAPTAAPTPSPAVPSASPTPTPLPTATAALCAHCQQPLSSGSHEAACGISGHYTCDGFTHAAAPCGKSGHTACDAHAAHGQAACQIVGHTLCDGYTHGPASCNVSGHTVCDGLQHEMAACGKHLLCSSTGADIAHGQVCSKCQTERCMASGETCTDQSDGSSNHAWASR